MMADVLNGMREWRTAHSTATFAEIEAAVDERLSRVRAQMLEDAALATAAADLPSAVAAARPRCPGCGTALVARGQQTRAVQVQGAQSVRLRRSYAACPSCGTGIFPLG
jgi:predicted RNA-binding Zn-ribbon protein involved in translation (DUF1610 family)